MAAQSPATRPLDCIDAITKLHFTFKNRGVNHAFTGLAGTVVRMFSFLQAIQRHPPEYSAEPESFLTRQRPTGNLVLAVEVSSGSLQQARNVLRDLDLQRHPNGEPSQVVCQFLLKTHHPSQRTHNDPWNPQECRIERGPQTFRIPTEPVVEAQCRRLRPLITVSETHLNEGYGRTHLPPPPLEAGCFSSECFAQIIANDYLHEPRLYDLNPSEWKAEVVRLFSQTEYHTMRNALVRLVERTLVQQGDRFITLLALSAAVQEESEIHNRWLLPAEDDERMNKLTGERSEIFKLVIQCFHLPYESEFVPAAR
ncbi:hypothetical protein NBRC10512v2_001265 [Rhodotorula toruloides]|uniref:Uncharacterized protein n=1 Tax=Rhodotorula toruloides (strain NP11) TaxID=1130832 RepID=M7XM28_RHOT1|nr:uncharacterized protein RHTO_02700 [Rhodotorula toruloides NP11]EMS24974.1 hypothetical protein RHTO_02700 [Rhodotorula toruloides NP11]